MLLSCGALSVSLSLTVLPFVLAPSLCEADIRSCSVRSTMLQQLEYFKDFSDLAEGANLYKIILLPSIGDRHAIVEI